MFESGCEDPQKNSKNSSLALLALLGQWQNHTIVCSLSNSSGFSIRLDVQDTKQTKENGEAKERFLGMMRKPQAEPSKVLRWIT